MKTRHKHGSHHTPCDATRARRQILDRAQPGLLSRSARHRRCPFPGLGGIARSVMATMLGLGGTVPALLVPALAQRGLKNIPDPDPEVQQATFQLAEGFEVNLFASDPMIAKPIQTNWDHLGRLWVAGSRIYPQIQPGQRETDQIVVIEDTDGDGRADKRTVFAEGLLIPTAVLPGDGGVYVANSTELLHLRDTDGDGRADTERVVLSGFGTEDTHHILHTMRWGPDGSMYFNQSIYIHSHIETPHGPRRLLAGGVWRFRPESMELEVYNRGLVNSWGLRFDRWGQSFQTDGAGGEGINYTFPGSVMVTAHSADRLVRGLNPGQPKLCSLEILGGEHVPEAWRDRLITADFRGNRVVSFELTPSGSGYVSRQRENLIQSSSVAFRPVDISQGPDGAIYIGDWYNPIIQHGEVDFRDPRRDHEHGRIWRITAKGRPFDQRTALDEPKRIVAALGSSSRWDREQATVALRANADNRHEATVRAMTPSTPEATVRQLWALRAMDRLQADDLAAAFGHESDRVRAAALRLANPNENRALVEGMVSDPHPQVRLEALHVLRRIGDAESARASARALDHEMDGNLDFALWLNLRQSEAAWTAAVAEDPDFFDNIDHLLHAMQVVNSPAALAPIVTRWQTGELSAASEAGVLKLIGEVGGGAELAPVFDLFLKSRGDDLYQVLRRAATRQRRARPAGDLERLHDLIDDDPRGLVLAGLWRLKSAIPKLQEAARGPHEAEAIEGLAAMGRSNAAFLTELTAATEPTPRRIRAATALCDLDPAAAAQSVAALLGETKTHAPLRGLVGKLIANAKGPDALTAALKDKTIAPGVAAACVRQLGSSGREHEGLAKTLQAAGKLQPILAKLEGAELDAFIADVKRIGHVGRGEQVYRRESLLCQTCHAIGGGGGLVGPDLGSIGASAPVDYLVDSIIQPGSKIKEGYHTTIVTEKDGTVTAGMVVRDTTDALVLRDAADLLRTVPKARIKSREISNISLMPPALNAQLRRDEFVDLVAFLSALGKPNGLTPPKARLARTWRVLTGGKPVNDAVRHAGIAHAAQDDPVYVWKPIYSRVDGTLPIHPELERFSNIDARNYFVVRTTLKVTQAGPIGLASDNTTGLRLWIGAEAVELPGSPMLETGEHVITVAIEEKPRKGHPLRLELRDAPASKGQAEWVLGK